LKQLQLFPPLPKTAKQTAKKCLISQSAGKKIDFEKRNILEKKLAGIF